MDDKQGSPILRESNGGVPGLAVIACVHQAEEGIKEDLASLLKGNVMLAEICRGLPGVPFKDLPLELKGNVDRGKCIYFVDTSQGPR
jgi:hypothetical protein